MHTDCSLPPSSYVVVDFDKNRTSSLCGGKGHHTNYLRELRLGWLAGGEFTATHNTVNDFSR